MNKIVFNLFKEITWMNQVVLRAMLMKLKLNKKIAIELRFKNNNLQIIDLPAWEYNNILNWKLININLWL